MDQNKDWKPAAALILAGLALFIALSGNGGNRNDQVGSAPQQIIIQPAAPGGTTGGTTAPVLIPPIAPMPALHTWGGWRGGGSPIFALFPLLFFAGILFLAFRWIGRGRRGWAGPGWQGGNYGAPGPGPQAPPAGQPYMQYPPQYAQGQGQYPPQYPQQAQGQYPPYSGYSQAPQGPQPQQGQQGQQTQAMDAHGDITRPEGSGE